MNSSFTHELHAYRGAKVFFRMKEAPPQMTALAGKKTRVSLPMVIGAAVALTSIAVIVLWSSRNEVMHRRNRSGFDRQRRKTLLAVLLSFSTHGRSK